MPRDQWTESPALRIVVIVVAACGLYFGFAAYERRQAKLELRVLRQSPEPQLLARERRPGMALSIWVHCAPAHGGHGNTDIRPPRFTLSERGGRSFPLFPTRVAFDEFRLDVRAGYGSPPDAPVLHATLDGTEIWRTNLSAFPPGERLLPVVTKDDPRLTAKMDGNNSLHIHLNRPVNEEESVNFQLLSTSFGDRDHGWPVEDVITYAGLLKVATGYDMGFTMPYMESVHEARIRVRIARLEDVASVVEIHGVEMQVGFGQPVTIVRNPIHIPLGPGQTLEIQKQTSTPRKAPKVIVPSITIPGGIATLRHPATEDPWSDPNVMAPIKRIEWIGPDPKGYGLKEIRLGIYHYIYPPGVAALATGDVGPLRPGPIDPIHLRIIRSKRVWIEDYTVTVPVHR